MFEQCCRMGCGMNLLQRSDGDLGIDLRGLQVLMSEHLLDEADVGSALVHQRRHRVAEQMAGAGLAQLGGVDPFLAHPKLR